MIAYCRLDARIPRPSAHHVPCIDARHGPLGQLSRPADGSAEQRTFLVFRDPCRRDIFIQILLKLSLRFKCNSLLHLNRELPGSAVYDLSTERHSRHSQHWRLLQDLPVQSIPMILRLHLGRWCCRHAGCKR
jgi:hypothetical protein